MKGDVMNLYAIWFLHIIFGTILFAVGAGVSSLGWHFINKWDKRKKWRLLIKKKKRKRCFHVFFVVSGLFLIGGGGTCTTLGWNQLDNHRQKQALIVACIREWRLNDSFLPLCRFTITDEARLSEHYSYPTFQLKATQNAHVSSLFDINHPKDYKLFKALTRYEYYTILLQDFLDMTDEGLYVAFAGRKPLDEHRRVNKSNYVKFFLKYHKELGTLFIKDYYSAFEKALKIQKVSIKEDQIEPNKPEDNKEGEVVKNKPEDNKK
ncbi:MAG: hypothetical protein WBC22_09550 [Sedimentisphaerales bacterium]